MSHSAPTDIDIGRFYTPQPVQRKFHASEARYPLPRGRPRRREVDCAPLGSNLAVPACARRKLPPADIAATREVREAIEGKAAIRVTEERESPQIDLSAIPTRHVPVRPN